MCDLTTKHCMPCEGGVAPIDELQEDRLHLEVPEWKLIREGTHKLTKSFRFADFKQAMSFVNRVADLAENEGHHPSIAINWNRVTCELYTHAIAGLSENDFILAARIDLLYT